MKIVDVLWWATPAVIMAFVTFMNWHTGSGELKIAVCALSVQIFVVGGCVTHMINGR